MQTPQRKPGKYTGLKPDANITREKYQELEDHLEHLLKRSRPRAAEEVKRLAADGDFSENHAYQMAKSRLRGINSRITEIEDHLKRAIIIEAPRTNGKVQLGSSVTIECEGAEKTYLILGPAETDPQHNVISHLSPLGSVLMNKKAGDIAIMKINNASKKYTILKVN